MDRYTTFWLKDFNVSNVGQLECLNNKENLSLLKKVSVTDFPDTNQTNNYTMKSLIQFLSVKFQHWLSSIFFIKRHTLLQLHFLNLNTICPHTKVKRLHGRFFFFLNADCFLVLNVLSAAKRGALTNCVWIVSLLKTPSDSLQPSEVAHIRLSPGEVSWTRHCQQNETANYFRTKAPQLRADPKLLWLHPVWA